MAVGGWSGLPETHTLDSIESDVEASKDPSNQPQYNVTHEFTLPQRQGSNPANIGDLHRRYLDRDLFGDLDAIGVEANHFAGVIGQQTNSMQAKIGQDLRAQAAFMLQLLLTIRRAEIRVIPDTWPRLVKVNQHPGSFAGDALERLAYNLMALAL